jgi:ABC-2 type transport system permease protein
MPIIHLALKDLRQLSRDRMTFLFLLIMPVVFTVLFGFAFSGSGATDPRLPVGLIDQDGGELAGQLVQLLESSTVIRLDRSAIDPARLEEMISEEDLAAGLVIPNGFSAGLLSGSPLLPVLLANPANNGAYAVQSEIEALAFRLASAVQTAQITSDTAGEMEGATIDFDATVEQALAAWHEPPVTLGVQNSATLAAAGEEDNADFSPYANTSPGMMAQFAIAGLMGAAGILVAEKQNRSLQRLLSINVGRMQILLGHLLAMFVMIFLQMLVLILFGQLVLKLPYFGQPLATLLVTIASAAFCASLGLLIGVLAKNEDQATVFAIIPMFVLAGLGGAWMPLEVTPEAFQRIAMFTPLAWIMEGFKDIIVRGQGLAAIAPAVAVLAAYSLLLFTLARWRFRIT